MRDVSCIVCWETGWVVGRFICDTGVNYCTGIPFMRNRTMTVLGVLLAFYS